MAVTIVRRTVILIILGLIVNAYPHFPLATWRIYGVLQRIALCYLCVGLFYLWRQDAASKVVTAVVLIAGYFLLLRFVPVPGAGMPGKQIPFLDPVQNLPAWVDRQLFPGRLFAKIRDPEGLLSTIPAVATALIGVVSGIWLRSRRVRWQTAAGMVASGLVLMALGKLWAPSFPMIKRLWTGSYVLFTGGVSLLFLGSLYWMIEVGGWRRVFRWPWIIFGTNAIFAYMLSELLNSSVWQFHVYKGKTIETLAYTPLFGRIHPGGLQSFIYSATIVIICWLMTLALWKRRIFLKV